MYISIRGIYYQSIATYAIAIPFFRLPSINSWPDIQSINSYGSLLFLLIYEDNMVTMATSYKLYINGNQINPRWHHKAEKYLS